jgi:hypothetical protein
MSLNLGSAGTVMLPDPLADLTADEKFKREIKDHEFLINIAPKINRRALTQNVIDQLRFIICMRVSLNCLYQSGNTVVACSDCGTDIQYSQTDDPMVKYENISKSVVLPKEKIVGLPKLCISCGARRVRTYYEELPH